MSMPVPLSFEPHTPDATESSFLRDGPPTPTSARFSHHNSSYSRRSSIRPLPMPPPLVSTSGSHRTPEADRSSVESILPVGISAVASPPDYKPPDSQEEAYQSSRNHSTTTSLGKDGAPLKASSPRQNPFSASFESPSWALIALHVGLCLIAYPVLMIFVLIAKNKTLFWTRFAISCGCGIVGFCLALSLLNLARAYLEAATWATLIHQSRLPEAPGLTLRDFAAASQGTSALVAARVLYNRIMYPGTARKQRKEYDARPWSLYVAYFLVLVLLAAALPFILGRLVEIDASIQHQHIDYREVAIKGDLSEVDIARAQEQLAIFDHPTLAWTMAHSTHGPPPTAFSYPWGNDEVYFAEASPVQFRVDGAGFGVFNDSRSQRNNNSGGVSNDRVSPNDVETGTTLRQVYPRWGIRMHCSKLPNPERHLIAKSNLNLTYLFAPRETMTELFTSFSLQFPTVLDRPLDTSLVIRPNDNVSVALDPNSLTLGAGFFDNGVSHSYFSTPINMGQDGGGFVSFEAVLVRLNTSFTPSGKFASFGPDSLPDGTGAQTRIGYDALICLELFEPWVVEVYNSTTGVPLSTRIITKASQATDSLSGEKNLGKPLDDLKRQLNSSALWPAYVVAHQNSVNQLVKDNNRDVPYIPSPLVISYSSEGEGPTGFTELSPNSFAQTRAQMDASNLLAFFAGTGDIVGRSYPDRVLSNARILTVPMVIVLALVLIFGVLAGMFVPKLPLGVPRRDFELYSWVAAFHGDEVSAEMNRAGIQKNMELREIEKRMGNLKFRYVFP